MQLPKSSLNFNQRPVFLPILAIFVLAFFVILLSENGIVFAGWTSPGAPPPDGNVPPPLNELTEFDGQVRGKYNSLNISMINNPHCTSSKSLIIGNNYDLDCSDPTFVAGLLEVLNNSSTAESFEGGVVLGDLDTEKVSGGNDTYLDVAGAITGRFLHILGNAAKTGVSSIFGNIELESGKSFDVRSSTADTMYYVGNYNDGLGFDFNAGKTAGVQVEGKVDAGKLCIKGDCKENWDGVGIGVFKQLSVTMSDGKVIDGSKTGYEAANAKCPIGMHVCTVEEILGTINKGLMPAILPNESAWISGGPPGFTAFANDCNGWATTTLGYLGRVWKFPQKYGIMSPCAISLKFACCQ